MIKRCLALILMFTTMVASTIIVHAEEDITQAKILTIDASASDMSKLEDKLDLVKDQANGLGISATTLSTDPMDILSNAVGVYMYSPEDTINLLSGSVTPDTFIDESKKIWRIPMGINSLGNYVYSNVTLMKDSVQPVTIENIPNSSNVEYIFDANLISNTLSNYGINGQSIIPISVQNIHSDFIQVVDESGQSYFISFSVRPDFLKLENGQIYSSEEVRTALQNLMDELNSDYELAGGISLSTFIFFALSVAGISGLIAFIFFIIKKNVWKIK